MPPSPSSWWTITASSHTGEATRRRCLRIRRHAIGVISAGIKTATRSALWEYEAEGKPLPEVGLKTVVLDGNGDPVCTVETTEVEMRTYEELDTVSRGLQIEYM